MIDKIVDIETNKLVIISEPLVPMYFPKNPEINDATRGRKIIKYSIFSILTF
tara:strand:- start:396 stop:551 length:156 start_codon:yes stop_codon:yes gene_type:complete